MRAHPAQLSFNAGELSPLLYGRHDLAKYANACRVMENALPTVQGPARRRGGMRFVASTKGDAKVWVRRFRFSRTQSYILEFGHLYIRLFANRAQLLTGATPIEVVTPYTSAQLNNEDGSFALSVAQDRDVLYIASGDHPVKELRRLGATDFSLVDFVTKNGPLQSLNANKTLRMYAAARTGSTVNVTASANYFTESMIGTFLRLGVENFTMPPWEPQKHFAEGDLIRSDGKTYIAASNVSLQVTGSRLPVHEEGRVLDGSGTVEIEEQTRPIGILWEYRDPGYGIGKIVSVSSPTVAVVSVVADMPYPDHVVGSGNATNVWRIGAWGAHAEYPRRVFFWNNRLCFFGRANFWMSVPREYDNFTPDIVGQVRADCAISDALPTTDAVRWAEAGDVVLVGTGAAEFVIMKQTEAEALGPNNIRAFQKSTYGSRALQPERVDDSVIMAQPSGRVVRQLRYEGDTGAYEAIEVTDLAEHIADDAIVDWAWQQEPDRVLWAVTASGNLIAATLDRRNDVYPWHRHPTRGLVESVCVIPSPDGKRDDVWLTVLRTIAGVPRRFVEVMDAGDERGRAQEDCFFVDAGLSYSGAPVTSVGGLQHLVGETVDVAANGAAHPPRVVSGDGTIELERPCTTVHVGLHSRYVVLPMPIESPTRQGSSQGKLKKVVRVGLRFDRTLGGKVGPSLERLDPLAFRYGHHPLGQAVPLYSGVIEPIPFEGDYELEGNIYIVQDQPLPMTLCAVLPELEQ